MSLTKQAKTLTKQQQDTVLSFISTTRHPKRNRGIFLLSARSGLRAKEIAEISWEMVTDASNTISDRISLTNAVSKGKRGGGIIWMHKELRAALEDYSKSLRNIKSSDKIVQSERRGPVKAQMIVNLFWGWYRKMGFDGCSSHSGRRTFITNAARKISTVGGSIKDVQMLARHKSLAMTQTYIEADVEAQKRVVQII